MRAGFNIPVVQRDHFQPEEGRLGFRAPCCWCIHRHGSYNDAPCKTCGHNEAVDGSPQWSGDRGKSSD